MTQADTLLGALERAAQEREGIYFVDRDEQTELLSFRDAFQRAARAAARLRDAGVRPGEHVALVLPTSPSFIDAFFGCLAAGAVPFAIAPPLRLGKLDEYWQSTADALRALDARALITDSRIRRLLGAAIARARPRAGVLDAAELVAASGRTLPGIHTADPRELALVQLSSGSTRDPAPIPLTHSEVLANVDAFLAVFGDLSAGRGVSWLPLHHDMGLLGGVVGAVRAARPLWLIPPELFLSRPAIWLRTISKTRANISPAPSFGYALAVERIHDEELTGVDLSCWRFALDGAEPISADVLRAFTARFARFGFLPESLTPVYGLAEAALAVTFSDPAARFRARRFDRDALAAGSARDGDGIELVDVGKPLSGWEIELRDARGKRLPDGRVGRLWVRGPSISSACLARAAASDGWLDTGDCGVRLGDELYITGRDKDMIVIRGRNHAPEPIERACYTARGVRRGCVIAFGDLDESGVERLIVLVETRKPEPRVARECSEAIAAATGLVPDRIELYPPGALPRTSSGKLRRSEAKRAYLRHALKAPAPVSRARVLGAMFKSTLSELASRLRAHRRAEV